MYQRTYGFTLDEIELLRQDRTARLALSNSQRSKLFAAVATWRPALQSLAKLCRLCESPTNVVPVQDGKLLLPTAPKTRFEDTQSGLFISY
jgi:hypothetical protein